MIRFPNRFHASMTPGASRIEANWLEPERKQGNERLPKGAVPTSETKVRKNYDFTALRAAMGW